MTKKTLKIFTAILAVILALAAAACSSKGNSGSTKVTLKTPGSVISNNGAVSETENYFYFVNGQEDATAENDYGKPVKGAIAVVSKSDLKKSEIVVPKIMSAKDYNAGIFVYGDCVYYGTTTTKKGSDGKIATDVLEFQKAKLDGSGVEEILDVTGLSTEYRFVLSGEKVYLLYVSDSAIYSVDVASGKKTTVSEKAAAYKWTETNELGEVSILFTETVAKYPDEEDNTETESYNVVKAYKAGEESAKTVLSGKMEYNGLSSDSTFTIKAVKAGYVFVTETPANNTVNTEKTYAVEVSAIYGYEENATKANLTESMVVVNTSNLDSAYIVSLTEIYYSSSDKIVRASLTASADNEVPVAKVGVTSLLGKDGDYMYYVTDDSLIARVELSETEIKDEQILTGKVNASWFSAKMVGDYIFWSDSADDGSTYMKTLNYKTIAAEDIEETTEDDTTTYTLKSGKLIALGVMTDEDVVYAYEAHLSAFKADAYDSNQKLNVRDEDGNLTMKDGKIYVEGFVTIQNEYNALTAAQKKLISDDGKKVYDLFTRALEADNLLYKLNNYIEEKRGDVPASGKTEAEWKTIAEEVQKGINEILKADDGKSVMNLVDNNLLWEYYDSNDGAYATLLKK